MPIVPLPLSIARKLLYLHSLYSLLPPLLPSLPSSTTIPKSYLLSLTLSTNYAPTFRQNLFIDLLTFVSHCPSLPYSIIILFKVFIRLLDFFIIILFPTLVTLVTLTTYFLANLASFSPSTSFTSILFIVLLKFID
jgi:hypothetical protein